MTTINDLVILAARDLNDYTDNVPNRQFQRWTVSQLLSYWNEALCVIFALNPSKFRNVKVAKLQPGINQVFDECKRVTSVIGVSDKDGNLLYEIEQDQEDRKLKWGGYRPRNCTTFIHTKDFKLKNYKILSDKDGSIIVKPAIPYGADLYLKFMCEDSPQPVGISDLDNDMSVTGCSDITFGIHWVLFRALMVDEESNSSTALADKHLQLFLSLVKEKQELDKEALYNVDTVPNVLKQYVAREIAKIQLGIK